jgi:photosystem II stability/assembly factor-like uncharacterized protein
MYPKLQCDRLLAALALSTVLAGAVAATEYAPVMPRAAQTLLLDIAAAGDRAVVAGARGHILYSDDNGSSWRQARVPTTQMLTGVHFVDSGHGWAVGHDGIIIVSDDGGANWRIQRDGIAVQQQANVELREEAYQQTRALEQAITIANETDRGALQQQREDAVMDLEDADLALEEAVFTSPLMDVWFQDRQRGWAVGAFGTLLATTDGGQHWISQSELVDNPDEFHLNTVTGDLAGRVFIAGEGGVMYRSLDSGKTWESLEPVYEGSWFGAVYSEPHSALLVFGLRGNLYRSIDFGSSWNSVAGDNTISLAGGSAASDGTVVLVGGVGTVLQSRDGGLSFQGSKLPDRLGLSSAMQGDDRLILVGQGGAKTVEDSDDG